MSVVQVENGVPKLELASTGLHPLGTEVRQMRSAVVAPATTEALLSQLKAEEKLGRGGGDDLVLDRSFPNFHKYRKNFKKSLAVGEPADLQHQRRVVHAIQQVRKQVWALTRPPCKKAFKPPHRSPHAVCGTACLPLQGRPPWLLSA